LKEEKKTTWVAQILSLCKTKKGEERVICKWFWTKHEAALEMEDDVLESTATDINPIRSIEGRIKMTNDPSIANHTTILLCQHSYDMDAKESVPLREEQHRSRVSNRPRHPFYVEKPSEELSLQEDDLPNFPNYDVGNDTPIEVDIPSEQSEDDFGIPTASSFNEMCQQVFTRLTECHDKQQALKDIQINDLTEEVKELEGVILNMKTQLSDCKDMMTEIVDNRTKTTNALEELAVHKKELDLLKNAVQSIASVLSQQQIKK